MAAARKPRFHRLWPTRNPAPHFQASIFVPHGAAQHALQAAKNLDVRGFAAQVFETQAPHAVDAGALAEAARKSGRFVIVESRGEENGLGAAVARSLSEAGFSVPIVHVGRYGLSAGHIAEACLRNLDQEIRLEG